MVPPVNSRARFLAWTGLAIAGLGLGPLFKKIALERGGDLWGVVQVAIVTGALATAAFQWLKDRRDFHCLVRWPAAGHLLLVGVLASGLVAIFNVAAMQHTTATMRALFQSAYPIGTALFAWLLLGERLTPVQWWLMAALVSGLMLLNLGDDGLQLGIGFWLLLATVPMIGFADAWVRGHLDQIAPTVQTTGRYLFAALLIVVSMAWTGPPAPGGWMIWAAAGGSVMAAGIYGLYHALQWAKAGLVGALVGTASLVTAIGEMSLLGARFGRWQWVGMAVLIGAGICLGRTDRGATRRRDRS